VKQIPVIGGKVGRCKAVVTESIAAQAESRLMADCDVEAGCMIDMISIYSI